MRLPKRQRVAPAPAPPPPPSSTFTRWDPNTVWEVESIVSHRQAADGLEYLVRWRPCAGCVFDDSWEHEVWQLSEKAGVRVVLLIRFWHPDIPEKRWPEAMDHMKRMLKLHRKRLSLPPLTRPSKLDTTPRVEHK